MHIPDTYDEFSHFWANHQQEAILAYTSQKDSFIVGLLPEQSVAMPAIQLFYILEKRFGQTALYQALNPDFTVPSPVAHQKDTSWIKTVNMVGINVRTISSFFNVVKYSLTLPASQSSIHLLPIWECGVVASLYGMASWNINPEFYDEELARAFPHLNTVEKQLKVVCNLLHLTGKTVGMDVIPHTDRYSEIALANPHFFEWLQRKEFEIINHDANLHEKVQERILVFLQQFGAVVDIEYPKEPEVFFNNQLFPEEKRLQVLFGEKSNLWGRNKKRNQLISFLFNEGYEPVPATMAPPYRGLAVDKREEAKTIDEDGRVWRDYTISKPEAMSRVFGPLARFKLYESLDNNQHWEIDFSSPRKEVWEYTAAKYLGFAQQYNFDFMRGDMSHVQLRKEGTPANPDEYYDIHKYIKGIICRTKPTFSYFAESFLAPPNTMAYGVEEEHLEGSDADSTLGDLQSMTLGSETFVSAFARYHSLLKTCTFAPNFTIITADKDDPRFDEFYLRGNEIRMFMGLFLSDMPSYMSLGFEQRDVHFSPAPNEHYTKLYVFQLTEGPKATHSKYQWGKNAELFKGLTTLRKISEEICSAIANQSTQWLIAPDFTGKNKVIAWTQSEHPQYLFIVNLDTEHESEEISFKNIVEAKHLEHIFTSNKKKDITCNTESIQINLLEKGEYSIYRYQF